MRARLAALALLLAPFAGGCAGSTEGPDGAPGATIWGRRFGKSTDTRAAALAVDGSGNAIVGGSFFATSDFGEGPVTSPANNWQAFVAKYDETGAPVWTRSFGDIFEEHVDRVAVDGSGNVYLAGAFRGTIDLGGGELESASFGNDVFLAKLAPDGAHLWSKRIGSEGYDDLEAMSVNAGGEVVLAGYAGGKIDFGAGPVDLGYQPFVAKWRADGTLAYAMPFEGENYSQIVALALDSAGSLVLSASFYDYDGTEGTVLVKRGPAGEPVWSRSFGSPKGTLRTSALALGSDDTIHLTGSVHGDVDLGGGVASEATHDANDAFVATLTRDGDPRWLRRFAPVPVKLTEWGETIYGEMSAQAIAARAGEIVVTGGYCGRVDFGGGERESRYPEDEEDSYSCYQNDDIFALKLDAAGGAYAWDATFGNPTEQAGTSVGLDPRGDVFIAGYANGALDFGAGGLADTAYYDTFVVKLAR